MPDVQDVVVRKPSSGEEAECKAWPTWGCSISEFPWEYQEQETCLLLEGEVEVTDNPETGKSVKFKAGDFVVFPAGLKCIWKVTKSVNKHYKFGE